MRLPSWPVALLRSKSTVRRLEQTTMTTHGYFQYEGLIETDRWFGPLFTNVRLTRTNAPTHFHADRPFVQLMPIHRANYSDHFLNDLEVHEAMEGIEPDDWLAYERIVVKPNANPIDRKPGAYAAATRKRARQDPAK
jgi:hypothetical protein